MYWRAEARPTVLIGKDTRISGYMLESALESGFNSAGVDVVLFGPVAYAWRGLSYARATCFAGRGDQRQPQPLCRQRHQVFQRQGQQAADAWELAVEQRLRSHPCGRNPPTWARAAGLDDAAGRYIEFCKSTFANDLTFKGMKIVVDAAHGAAYHIAPKVFHELGAEVIAIGCSPDGLNINKGVGATHPEALVQAVKDHRADFGVALDGDADRPATGRRQRPPVQWR